MRYSIWIILIIIAIQLTVFAQKSGNTLTENDDYGFSANVTLVRNYIFRGVSQSNNNMAIQGGIDYDLEDSYHFGTWASSLIESSPLELDLYTGYHFTFSEKYHFELKGTAFIYPFLTSDNSFEVSFQSNYKNFGVRYSYDLILHQHYFDFGMKYDFTTNFWITARGGLKEKKEGGSKSPILDGNIKLAYKYRNFSLELLGSYHEIEKYLYSIGIKTEF